MHRRSSHLPRQPPDQVTGRPGLPFAFPRTRFDRFYTPTAICAPARASLLTGQAPFRHRMLANYERNVGYLEDLREDAFTFPSALADRDPQLGLIGKWHVGTHRNAASYGFDGPDLPGRHNPVDHPDYLAYLEGAGRHEHGRGALDLDRRVDPARRAAPQDRPGLPEHCRRHRTLRLRAHFEEFEELSPVTAQFCDGARSYSTKGTPSPEAEQETQP